MTRRSWEYGFAAFLLALFAGMLVLALDFPRMAGRMPLLVAVGGLVLSVAQLASLLGKRGAAISTGGSTESADAGEAGLWNPRLSRAVLGMVVFGVASVLAGLNIVTLSIGTFYYSHLNGLPLGRACLFGGALATAIVLFFQRALSVPLPSGLLLG